MTQYTGTPKIVTTISLADASTPFNAAAVTAADEANWDAIQAIKGQGFQKSTFNSILSPVVVGDYTNIGTYRLGGGLVFTSNSTNITYATARTYYRAANGNARYNSATWEAVGAGHYQRTRNLTDFVRFYFELPAASILKKASIHIAPNPAHVALPGTMPKIDVYSVTVSTMVGALSATQADTSAAVLAYNTPHSITCTLPNISFGIWGGVDLVYVDLYGESNADPNALDDLFFGVPYIEYTRAQLGQEFGVVVP